MSNVDQFDSAVLEPVCGIRALWLLYRRGKWGYLADFGLERAEIEARLERFSDEHVVVRRLSVVQARHLADLVPELIGAGVELRLAYALKFYCKDTEGVVHEILSRPGIDG